MRRREFITLVGGISSVDFSARGANFPPRDNARKANRA